MCTREKVQEVLSRAPVGTPGDRGVIQGGISLFHSKIFLFPLDFDFGLVVLLELTGAPKNPLFFQSFGFSGMQQYFRLHHITIVFVTTRGKIFETPHKHRPSL
jgi:hypothetical protein